VDFFRRLTDRLRVIPGVQGAAAMQGLPPYRLVNANDTDFEGYTAPQEGPFENVDYYQTVTQEYLTTMGIPVVEGRDFSPADATGAPVVLVNETLAKTFYKDSNPVGKRLKPGFGGNSPWFTIAGVVRDVKQGGVDKKTGTELYFLNEQGPRAANRAPGSMNIVIRTALPLETVSSNIREIVQAMDPSLPIVRLRTMEDVFAESVARPRFLAQLLGLFAGLALALAAIGTYGVLAYSVSERRKEIGIHVALGASRSNVLGMVLGQGLRLTVVGVVVGLAAAFGLTRMLQAQLFNVKPTDPATITAVVVFIATVALIACYLPASRATRVDPMVVLRDE
jgi:predicted permease